MLLERGTAVAWWYPDQRLVVALGTATTHQAGVPLARRTAVNFARATLLRAVATMRGGDAARVSGTVRNSHVVRVEIDDAQVRVYLVVRHSDVTLGP